MDNMENLDNNQTPENIENIENAENIEGIEKSNEEAEALESEEKAKKRKAGWLIRELFEWGETLVSAVVIIVVVFTFAVRVTSVDGSSMVPTLHDEDRMLVYKFFYTPKHDDIVVIFAPNLKCNCKMSPTDKSCSFPCSERKGQGKDIIKRVIGVEGDTIRIELKPPNGNGDGMVYRKGKDDVDFVALEEVYVGGETFAKEGKDLYVEIKPGEIFVLGDNRENSSDSRVSTVGIVDVNYVAGRAFFRVAPFNAFGFVK